MVCIYICVYVYHCASTFWGGYVWDWAVQWEVEAWNLRCKTLLRSGNMGQSRERKGMTAPAVIKAVLGKHLKTGFGFVWPVYIVGWVIWEVYGSVLVSVNMCMSRARGRVCVGLQFEGQIPFAGDQGPWVGAGTKQSDSPATARASYPIVRSDLHGDAWFVVGNVGKGLPCNHTAVTC